jgi:hypothetical protein
MNAVFIHAKGAELFIGLIGQGDVMRKTLLCLAALSGMLAIPAAHAANDGVQEDATFETVEIFIVVAKRSAVANDGENKAAHLVGIARAQRDGDTLRIEEHESDDGDGFIDLAQKNPGKSPNSPVPQGHLTEMQLTLVNNTFEGTGVFIFDTDGDGGVGPDDDQDEGDEFDDDDQVIPVRVRAQHRSNARTDFLQGTLHNSLDDAGSIGGEAAEATDQPRINGRIRSSRHGG